NPEKSAELFHDGWLDSGDLGYLANGEIYLTSRVKDLIIRGGRNLYPYELEQAVGAIEGVRKGCVAVFGGVDKNSGTEQLVVLAETRETDQAARQSIENQIVELGGQLLGIPPSEWCSLRLTAYLKPPAVKFAVERHVNSSSRERSVVQEQGFGCRWCDCCYRHSFPASAACGETFQRDCTRPTHG
ncbi:hypothetical protein BOW15_08455, partial [Solemya velum gill symbiont]